MKIARVLFEDCIYFAEIVDCGGKIMTKLIDGDLFGSWSYMDMELEVAQVKLLAPIEPYQIIAVGRNYADHAKELGNKVSEYPVVFLKGNNSVIGSDEHIFLPEMAPSEVDFEAELAVVIGKNAKNISASDVSQYIFGYTCANDVSARDCQLRIDKQWARGKSFDTFCPIGPYIETDLNPSNLNIKSILNGEVMQSSNTSKMIVPVYDLISYLSKCMTLYAGTIILTGTPAGVGEGRSPKVYLKSKDEIIVEIENIGSLRNFVK